MRTVKEVSQLSGVSIRALHHYDAIGLLRPSRVTEAGYRLYDDRALERLQMILLFRALDFPLKDIGQILDSPDFDRNKALEQQLELLRLQRERLDRLIAFARDIQRIGVKNMDFSAFDNKKQEQYAKQAKESWGHTRAYQEFAQKSEGRQNGEEAALAAGLMEIFRRFGQIKTGEPDSKEAKALVLELQDYITRHYYTCTPQILKGLSCMYCDGGEMNGNIDKAGGEGTGAFAARAIRAAF